MAGGVRRLRQQVELKAGASSTPHATLSRQAAPPSHAAAPHFVFHSPPPHQLTTTKSPPPPSRTRCCCCCDAEVGEHSAAEVKEKRQEGGREGPGG